MVLDCRCVSGLCYGKLNSIHLLLSVGSPDGHRGITVDTSSILVIPMTSRLAPICLNGCVDLLQLEQRRDGK
jgi:hypothetical protein